MYKVLEALRKPGESNEALANRLHIEINHRADGKVDPTDLSRTFSDRGFARIAEGLRSWAQANPQEWLSILASSRDEGLWDEYRDLMFLTEGFWRETHEAMKRAADEGATQPLAGAPPTGGAVRLANEVWVLAGEPAELDNAREREFSALRMRMGQRMVYWLPMTDGPAIAARLVTEFRFTGLLDDETLDERLFVVLGPDVIGHLVPLAINDPHGEGAMGFTGTRHETGNVRVTVVPQRITSQSVRWLRGVYMSLLRSPRFTTRDGAQWRLVRGSEALEFERSPV